MTRWPLRHLDQIAKIYGGSTPSRDNPSYWDGDIPWFTPTDLPVPDSGISIAETARERISQLGLVNSSATMIPKGSILFSSRATIGKVAVAGLPLATNQGFVNFVPTPEIDSRFLAYSLWHKRHEIARLSGSTTFKEVSRASIRRVQIEVPPLEEQERIVRILDEADELRKLRAQADQKTATLIPALFHQMFGDPASNPFDWPLICAGELMAHCEYGTSEKANESGTGVPVLRMNNVTFDGRLNLASLKTVELSSIERQKHSLASGDVLFNRTNSRELVGKTGMWDGQFEAVPASYFIRIRFDQAREHPHHFTTFMNLPFMKRRLASIARGAVGQANINSKELRSLQVPVPPIDRQREFAAHVDEIESLYTGQTSNRTRLDDLFQSLLHRAFTGSL